MHNVAFVPYRHRWYSVILGILQRSFYWAITSPGEDKMPWQRSDAAAGIWRPMKHPVLSVVRRQARLFLVGNLCLIFQLTYLDAEKFRFTCCDLEPAVLGKNLLFGRGRFWQFIVRNDLLSSMLDHVKKYVGDVSKSLDGQLAIWIYGTIGSLPTWPCSRPASLCHRDLWSMEEQSLFFNYSFRELGDFWWATPNLDPVYHTGKSYWLNRAGGN